MDSMLSSPATPQTSPWYRQRGSKLVLAVVLFLLPLVAIAVVAPQPWLRKPLALRSQRVLRLETFRSATTVLIAQTATGLLRSVDAGNSFSRIDLGLPRSGIGQLRLVDWTVSGADQSQLYALVGNPGQERLYRSDDTGDTWRVIGRLPALQAQEDTLRAIAAAPSGFSTLYVIGEQNLWRSSDGGRTWSHPRPLPREIRGTSRPIAIVAAEDADTIFASTGIGLWTSEDGGQNWKQAGDLPPLTEIASISPANDRFGLIFAGGRGLVFTSLDNGKHWIGVAPRNARGLLRVMSVDPRVGETAFAVDENSQIFRTDDAGRHWQVMDSSAGQQILDLTLNPTGRDQLITASSDGIWLQPIALLVPTPTPTPSATPTHSSTPTSQPTATPTNTSTSTPTPTRTPTQTPMPTLAPSTSPGQTSTRRATATRTPQATAQATHSTNTPASAGTTQTPQEPSPPVPTQPAAPPDIPTPTPPPQPTSVPIPTDTPVPPPTDPSAPTDTPEPTPEPR